MADNNLEIENYFYEKNEYGEYFNATFESDDVMYDSVTIDTSENLREGNQKIEDLGIHEMNPKDIIEKYKTENSKEFEEPFATPIFEREDIKENMKDNIIENKSKIDDKLEIADKLENHKGLLEEKLELVDGKTKENMEAQLEDIEEKLDNFNIDQLKKESKDLGKKLNKVKNKSIMR